MATAAEKVSKYREMAKDTSLPQEVRNQYLDKATELEYKAYEETKGGKSTSNTPEKKMAKGGNVGSKAPMKMAKGGSSVSKKPALVIAVGVAKPKGKAVMAKGGAVKGKC